jgi:hypothetical protein
MNKIPWPPRYSKDRESVDMVVGGCGVCAWGLMSAYCKPILRTMHISLCQQHELQTEKEEIQATGFGSGGISRDRGDRSGQTNLVNVT